MTNEKPVPEFPLTNRGRIISVEFTENKAPDRRYDQWTKITIVNKQDDNYRIFTWSAWNKEAIRYWELKEKLAIQKWVSLHGDEVSKGNSRPFKNIQVIQLNHEPSEKQPEVPEELINRITKRSSPNTATRQKPVVENLDELSLDDDFI